MRNLLLIVLAFLISACASEAEKRERRQNAFDLSGVYKTNNKSEIDMTFEVVNQSGRHDISIAADRMTPYTDAEKKALAKFGLNVDEVIAFFGSHLEMGTDSDKHRIDGGDNISDDFGNTSTFAICTKVYRTKIEKSDIRAYYCISATASKNDKLMKGRLSLNVVKATPRVKIDKETKKEETFTYIETSDADLNFSVNMAQVFYKQYLGSWTADEIDNVTADSTGDAFKRIAIRETRDQLGKLRMTVAPAQALSLPFRGEIYNYDDDASSASIEDASAANYPTVQLVFQGPDHKRIVFFAQAWSLGNLTGTVVYIDSVIQEDLAAVRMNKN